MKFPLPGFFSEFPGIPVFTISRWEIEKKWVLRNLVHTISSYHTLVIITSLANKSLALYVHVFGAKARRQSLKYM